MGNLTAADAHRIAIALAQAVNGALGDVGGDGVLADDAAECGKRLSVEATGWQRDGVDGFDARGNAGLAQTAGHETPESLGVGQGEGPALFSPAPPFHSHGNTRPLALDGLGAGTSILE
jgi:hypothetical protein